MGHMTDIADAIREKDGTLEGIRGEDFAQRIRDIPTGGSPVRPDVSVPSPGTFIGGTAHIAYQTEEYEIVYQSDQFDLTIAPINGVTAIFNGGRYVVLKVDSPNMTTGLRTTTITVGYAVPKTYTLYIYVHTAAPTADNYCDWLYLNNSGGVSFQANTAITSWANNIYYTATLGSNTITPAQQIVAFNTRGQITSNNFLSGCRAFNQPLPTGITTVGDNFLYNCASFNQPLPPNLTTTGIYFLYGCGSFNQPLPTGIATAQGQFLSYCYSFNQPLPPALTKISSYFLTYCYSFNQPLPPNLTTIGSEILSNCRAFNQPLPTGLISVGSSFLSGCRAFNQPLPTGITTVGAYFLDGCTSFNQPLPTGITVCPEYFLYGCSSFNQALPAEITTVGNNFVGNCSAFNQPLPVGITTIPHNFLVECTSFNQPLPPNLISVGNGFLSGCRAFNQPLPTGITTVGDNFLYSCYSFNQPLPSGLVTIGATNFMLGCSSFNQSCNFSSVVFTSALTAFMYGVYSMNNKYLSIGSGFKPSSINTDSLSIGGTDYQTTPMYKIGIGITGDGGSNFRSKAANNTTRKLYAT